MPHHALQGLVLFLSLMALPAAALAQGNGGSVVEVRGPQVAGGLLLGRTEPDARVRFELETDPEDVRAFLRDGFGVEAVEVVMADE